MYVDVYYSFDYVWANSVLAVIDIVVDLLY